MAASLEELEQRIAALEGQAGGDTVQPTFLTIDPLTGRIGADFTGHVHAQGLELDVSTVANPPDTNRLRWLRPADGSVGAVLWCYDDGTITEARYFPSPVAGEAARLIMPVAAGALPGTFQNASIVVTADPVGDIAKIELVTNFHNLAARTWKLIDNSGGATPDSDFVMVRGLASAAALPAGVREGQILWYQAAADTIWQFRWNSATSVWDFIGGPPLIDTKGDEALGAGLGAWIDTATIPSVTVPLAGDYNVRAYSEWRRAGGALDGFIGIAKGAAVPVLQAGVSTNAANVHNEANTEGLVTGMAAGGTIRLRFFQGVGGTCNVNEKRLFVTPKFCT